MDVQLILGDIRQVYKKIKDHSIDIALIVLSRHPHIIGKGIMVLQGR
jgi:predicted methyltransferase